MFFSEVNSSTINTVPQDLEAPAFILETQVKRCGKALLWGYESRCLKLKSHAVNSLSAYP
jgi:hypothetical protein